MKLQAEAQVKQAESFPRAVEKMVDIAGRVVLAWGSADGASTGGGSAMGGWVLEEVVLRD